jgi:O-antigen/teichoic acid export membrane protein
MRRKFVHDISANTLQVIINQVCGVTIFYVLSVYFSKNDFGEINWALAVLLTAFGILSFGIDQLVIKKIASGEEPRLILSVYVFHVLMAGGLFYSCLLISYFFLPGIFLQHNLLLFLGLGKLMIFLSSPFKQLAIGLGEFKPLLYMSICSNVVRAILLILFSFFATFNITNVIIIFIIGDMAELLLSVFIAKKWLRTSFSIVCNKLIYLKLLKEALPQAGVVVFTSSIARFDWIFLGIFASNIALAEYSFAFKIFEVATLPLLVVAPVLIPRFTRLFYTASNVLHANEKKDDLFVLLRFEIVIACFVTLVLNILWVPVIDFITHSKYGIVNRYTILILSSGMPFIYVNNFLWTLNFVQNRLKMIFYIFLVTFLFNIIGDIVLIPFYGGKGAAVAYLLAVVIQYFLFWAKTDFQENTANKSLLSLCPLAAFVTGCLSIFTFDTNWPVWLMSFCGFFLLLFISRLLRKNDWLIFKRITGI